MSLGCPKTLSVLVARFDGDVIEPSLLPRIRAPSFTHTDITSGSMFMAGLQVGPEGVGVTSFHSPVSDSLHRKASWNGSTFSMFFMFFTWTSFRVMLLVVAGVVLFEYTHSFAAPHSYIPTI